MLFALVSGTPIASAAPVAITPTSKASPDKNTTKGSPSEIAEAVAKARKTKKRVEVPSEQTVTDSVFANPDGTVTRERAAAPIRAKDDNGELAPIDTNLEKKDSGLVPKVATGDVSFSSTGEGNLASYEVADGASVALGYAGELETPTPEGSTATYNVKGSDTEKVTAGALPDGFVSHVLLSKAPEKAPTYTFTLDLKGLKADLKGNVLELSDADDKVVASSRPLRMWDAARDEHGDPSNVETVDAKLVDGANGTTELQLSPSMAYLTDSTTQYPVTVDPDIAKVEARGDTYYFEGQATNDSRGSEYNLRTGEQNGDTYRSLVTWAYEDYVGQTITNATLKLYQYSSDDANNCQAHRSDFFPTTSDTDLSITWATKPTVETSARFRSSKTYNHGDENCPDAFEDINVTPIVSAWAGGVINSDTTTDKDRQGIELRAENENDPDQEKRYCSLNLSGSGECNSTSKVPVLSVSYAAELGEESFYSMTSHPLNSASELSVNNRTGNAYLSANDASVNARGIPFSLDRAYNSQSQYTTSMGRGWNLGLGPDVWLEKRSQYRYDYHSPDGTVFGSFVRKTADTGSSVYDNFITPLGGVGADLDQDPADDEFILTMRKTQTKYRFAEMGPDGHAYLNKITDRSGNSMSFTYSGTTPSGAQKMSSITDAGGRTYAVVYTDNHITSIKENAGLGREWKYAYTGDYLTSHTNADSKVTEYAYDTGFTGPDLLKTITNPESSTGQRPTTNLTYGLDAGLSVDQVVKVGYVLDDSTTYEYTFNYHANDNETPICPNDKADFSTEVTDPNAAVTTHCFKNRDSAGGKAKEWIYDGEERERSADFNADRQSEVLTEGISGSTVATYAASTPDQLETVKEPDSDAGRNGKRTSIDYDHDGGGDSSPKGGKYLPGSVTDPNGDCIRYEYDSTGRATATITDLRGSGTDRSCANDTSGGAEHKFVYNSDGTVAKSTDPNAGASPTDNDRTMYTYWAPGDADFVAGSQGLIKSVREPGGDCSTTTASRKLCESYTYDAAGRVVTVTDGKNQKTTIKYDVIDRTTGVFFGGSTACNVLAGNNNCITYTYDAEGNLTKRAESNTNTTFTYDRLNRQLTNTQPGSIILTMSYDGVANLTGYTQKIGSKTDTVTYTYDQGNIVSSVTDAVGTIDINTDGTGDDDEDPYIEEYIFPGNDGIKIDLDVKDNGKTESIEVLANQGSGPTQFKIAYDYTDGDNDEDQLQSRTTSSAGADLNGTINYEYEYGRLASATDSSTAGPNYTYTHDKIGNVTSEQIGATTTHYGYDRAGQLCWRGTTDGADVGSGCPATPAGNTVLGRDAAGNNTNTSGTNATTYNNRNQVTKLGTLAMTYRDLGNDLRSKAGNITFIEGLLGITGTSVSGLLGATTVTWYTRMPDGTILNSRQGTETQNFFTEPHNKSVAALFSPAGSQTASYVYSPYGETTVHSGGAVANNNPFRYISGFQDTPGAEDYYKFGARYYDGHGHFTQPDPLLGSIINPRSMTAYGYAHGDPINLSDPTGLKPDPLCKVKGSTGYYYPNCGGYISGGGGGGSVGAQLACTGGALTNLGLLGYSAYAAVVSTAARVVSGLGGALGIGTGTFDPMAPTKAACKNA